MTQNLKNNSEEIDFRQLINRLLRAWPLFLVSVGCWIFLAVLLQILIPGIYTAKTSVLIEKPQGTSDPSSLTTQTMPVKTEANFYRNQKIAFKSYPLVFKSIRNLNLNVQPVVEGILLDKDLYNDSPIYVEVDTGYRSMPKYKVPFGTTFYVKFDGFQTYDLTAEGEYPITEEEFVLNGTFNFGEWVDFQGFKWRITPVDTVNNPDIIYPEEIFESTYGFVLKDEHEMTLEYIENLEVVQEDIEASVFYVTKSGSIPARQQDFLFELGQVFVADHLEQKSSTIKKAISYLNGELATISDSLETSELYIENYKLANGISSLNTQTELLLQGSAKYEEDRVNIVIKNRYYDYLSQFLSNNENYASLLSPQAFGINDPLLTKLTDELVSLQQEKNALQSSGTTGNPLYRQIESRIASNKSAILETINGFKTSNALLLENINSEIAALDAEARNIPRTERELLKLERQQRITESLYVNLMEKKAQAEVSLVSISSDFRIIEPAYITSVKPSFPNIIINGILAVILGLMLPGFYLIGKSIVSGRVNTLKDVARYVPAGMPVIPLKYSNITTPKDLLKYPNSATAQEIAEIARTSLSKVPANNKVLTLSSYGVNEGKTTLASLLAVHLAKTGKRIALCDLNFADPNLHKQFGVSNKNGLSDALVHETELPGPITTDIAKLDIFVAGSAGETALHDSARIFSFLSNIQSNYDLVICDTAPVSYILSSKELIGASGHNLFVLRAQKSSFEGVEKIEEIIAIQPSTTLLFNGSFDSITLKEVWKNRNGYLQNKPRSFFAKVSLLFKRIA